MERTKDRAKATSREGLQNLRTPAPSAHLKLNFRKITRLRANCIAGEKQNIVPRLNFQELRCVSTAHGDWQTSLYAVGEGSCPADFGEVRNPSTTRSDR